MATNPYFNFFTNTAEQALIEDLIVESIRIYGHDMWYLPRTGINRDNVLNEYKYSRFTSALSVELYIKSYSSFEGDGQFLQKFGLEVRDQITLTLSIRSFKEFIQPTTNELRPLEGDCIFIPMLAALYQIKFVESAAVYYQMGSLQTWDLTLELFETSGEEFATGVSIIDDTYNSYDQNAYEYTIQDEDGEFLLTEDDLNIIADGYEIDDTNPVARNEVFAEESVGILDFSEGNPFGSLF